MICFTGVYVIIAIVVDVFPSSEDVVRTGLLGNRVVRLVKLDDEVDSDGFDGVFGIGMLDGLGICSSGESVVEVFRSLDGVVRTELLGDRVNRLFKLDNAEDSDGFDGVFGIEIPDGLGICFTGGVVVELFRSVEGFFSTELLGDLVNRLVNLENVEVLGGLDGVVPTEVLGSLVTCAVASAEPLELLGTCSAFSVVESASEIKDSGLVVESIDMGGCGLIIGFLLAGVGETLPTLWRAN